MPVAAIDQVLRALPEDGACMKCATVAALTGLDPAYVSRKARELMKLGLLKKAGSRACYWLTDDGIARRNAGQTFDTRQKPHAGTDRLRDRLWAAMRAEKNFDRNSLLMLAGKETDRDPAHYTTAYLRRLEAAGVILRLKQKRKLPRYRLMRDLGPLAPTWQRTRATLFDRNSNQIVRPEAEAVTP